MSASPAAGPARRNRRPSTRPPRPDLDELGRQIARLEADGLTAGEIAAQLGVPRHRVYLTAEQCGVGFTAGLGGNARRLRVVLPAAVIPALDAIAAGAKVGRSEMARRIVMSVLEGSQASSTKLLGGRGQPPRPYRRQDVFKHGIGTPFSG